MTYGHKSVNIRKKRGGEVRVWLVQNQRRHAKNGGGVAEKEGRKGKGHEVR